MFNPSRACTESTSPFFLSVSAATVEYTCSRVSYNATLSMSGVTMCTPGYSVPGRAPQIWLMRTPADPSGITTMLSASSSGKIAVAANCRASFQRTGAKGTGGKVAGALSPFAVRLISRLNRSATYTS
jgi:hypothetical protein